MSSRAGSLAALRSERADGLGALLQLRGARSPGPMGERATTARHQALEEVAPKTQRRERIAVAGGICPAALRVGSPTILVEGLHPHWAVSLLRKGKQLYFIVSGVLEGVEHGATGPGTHANATNTAGVCIHVPHEFSRRRNVTPNTTWLLPSSRRRKSGYSAIRTIQQVPLGILRRLERTFATPRLLAEVQGSAATIWVGCLSRSQDPAGQTSRTMKGLARSSKMR